MGRSSFFRRLGAVLCIALMMVFTQAGIADSVANVQHEFAGGHGHTHMLFTDMAFDEAGVLADHEGVGQDLSDLDGDHHGSAHQHNGEFGLTPLLLCSATVELWHSIPPSTGIPMAIVQSTGIHPSLLERPPRNAHSA